MKKDLQRIIMIQELGRIFMSENAVTKQQLIERCSVHLDNNWLHLLTKNNILSSTRGKNSMYTLHKDVTALKLLTNSQIYANKLIFIAQNVVNEKRRIATANDYRKEIKRLKSILDYHRIKY